MSYGHPAYNLANASLEGAAAYLLPTFNDADAVWDPVPVSVEVSCRVATMLGAPEAVFAQGSLVHVAAPTMLAAPQAIFATGVTILCSSRSPLAAPSITAFLDRTVIISTPGPLRLPKPLFKVWISGLTQVPSMLGAPALHVSNDSTGQINPAAPVSYVMDLVTPGGLVRVPVSSWQATLQTLTQNYVQCVVPATTDWVPSIEAATEFIISRVSRLFDGTTFELEMARAPTQAVALNGGSFNYTATISGYTPALPIIDDPLDVFDRTLTGVRTVSRGAGTVRVRCNIDWTLRPGQRAYLEAEPIIVAFINYYVPGFDAYMDVGDRV